MKHHVSVYNSRTGALLENLCKVFTTKADADAYAARIKQQHTGITIL